MRHFVHVVLSLSIVWFFGCASSQPSASIRDYEGGGPIIPIEASIIAADDQPWEELSEGVRGKFYFSDRLTLIYLEMVDANKRPPYSLHHHHHDQIVYVLEGRSLVRLGDETREVGPGDAYIATSNMPHTLNALTDKVVMIEVFTPTREEFRTIR